VEARGFRAEQARRVMSKEAASVWALQDTLERVQARF
jgi:sterol carrier protein 2